MAEQTSNKVVPFEFVPDAGSERVTAADGKDYLVANDAMFTFFRRTKGELSPFFIGLKEEKRVLGCKCTKCGIVRVPPFLQKCPDCDFAPTELVEMPQVGKMLSTPPITYFANAMFLHMAPFGRGRVVLHGADTAMSVNVYTTTGILVPGIVKKDTEVKIIFRDNRIGEISDIFVVPAAELTAAQVKKKGLQESDIKWAAAREPATGTPSAADLGRFNKSYAELQSIAAEMTACERARQDIADWKRNILVKTKGGQFALKLNDGDISAAKRVPASPDLVMVCEDIDTLVGGLAYRGSLTQAIITRKLWISKNLEFTTIFKLERMARSLARSKKT